MQVAFERGAQEPVWLGARQVSAVLAARRVLVAGLPEAEFVMSAVPMAAKASGAEQLVGLAVVPAVQLGPLTVEPLESLTVERAPKLADA